MSTTKKKGAASVPTPARAAGTPPISELQGLREFYPFPWIPIDLGVSGSYTPAPTISWKPWPIPIPTPKLPIDLPSPGPFPPYGGMAQAAEDDELGIEGFWPIFKTSETLKLDVDGSASQSTASGTLKPFFGSGLHWIAKLKSLGGSCWEGPIWFKEGSSTLLPYTRVEIQVTSGLFSSKKTLVATFTGASGTRKRTFNRSSKRFREVELEYDCVSGVTPVLDVDTHDHPTRPGTLPSENLTIDEVFERSGFDVKRTGGDSIVPLSAAGSDAKWSDSEMHDAMQTYWSRFADKPQWSMWTFFAALSDSGTGLGGIMFDDIGPNHRQGTAIFNESFIKNAPSGDADPTAWTRRMRFWTAVHEMGHAFNLAHSWQKSLGTSWVPLANESEARSFMNYPYYVSGGQSAFFGNFEYRFSDAELLFLRHAPEAYVQMGNADWFDDHGFRDLEGERGTGFELTLRTNRPKPAFEFLEPAVIELKLKNVSGEPRIVPADLLENLGHVLLVSKRHGDAPRRHKPFAHYCHEPRKAVLESGKSLYEAAFIGAGAGGWEITDPGTYTIQAIVEVDGQTVVSNALEVHVRPPRGYDEECVAQDMFGGTLGEEVGRVLRFDGSAVLDRAVDVLRDVSERAPDSLAALHADVAIGCTEGFARKRVLFASDDAKSRGKVERTEAEPSLAGERLHAALAADMDRSADALGHIDLNAYTQRYAEQLAEQGEATDAKRLLGKLEKVLGARGVLSSVLADIKAKAKGLGR